MIAVLILLGVVTVATSYLLFESERRHRHELVECIEQAARERRELIDVIVSRHSGDLRALRAPAPESTEVTDYKRRLAAELEQMGYEPADVPGLPEGF